MQKKYKEFDENITDTLRELLDDISEFASWVIELFLIVICKLGLLATYPVWKLYQIFKKIKEFLKWAEK